MAVQNNSRTDRDHSEQEGKGHNALSAVSWIWKMPKPQGQLGQKAILSMALNLQSLTLASCLKGQTRGPGIRTDVRDTASATALSQIQCPVGA